jgi:hypothetical protein
VRGALIAAGMVVMGYAVLGAATDPDLKPGGVLLFLAVVLVAHDGVLLPLTIGAGVLLGRFAPGWARPAVRTAAIVTLAVGLVALPLVLGYGRSADNPSILPLAYGRGLLLILTLTWATALAAPMLTRLRTRRANHQTTASEPGADQIAGAEQKASPEQTADQTASPERTANPHHTVDSGHTALPDRTGGRP